MVKGKAWEALSSYLRSLYTDIATFNAFLGLREGPFEMVPVQQVIDFSKLYENRNMIKHGTHSTNCLIMLYVLNQRMWGAEYPTREKFFAKSAEFFETSLEASNAELAKHSICLKLHPRGEVKVYYSMLSFLKRVTFNNGGNLLTKQRKQSTTGTNTIPASASALFNPNQ